MFQPSFTHAPAPATTASTGSKGVMNKFGGVRNQPDERHNATTHRDHAEESSLLLPSKHSGVTFYSYSQNGVVDLDEPVHFENQWTLWFDKYLGPGKTVEEYAAAMQEIGTFSTVQDFWRYFNNLPPFPKLPPGASLHLMKKGIRPLWEDEGNVEGGTFSFKISKAHVDKVWLYLALGVVGEQFDCLLAPRCDDICGLSVSIRRQGDDVVSIWNRDASAFNMQAMFERAKFLVPGAITSCEWKEPKFSPHKEEADFKSK